ncbi:MAG: protein kinase [Anaerolineae bacterium]|nr:protein kinase [Anaerolineae bacterium]
MTSSLIGQRLGKYEIIELLGQGGMATVYKGYQPDIDRFVAVKVLPPHPGQDAQFMERFRLEARTIAQLQHPHILPMHDYGNDHNILYLVMAYVGGGSLKDRISEGPMPLSEVEVMLRQISSALDYAHRRGVVHRDIKPDNILLDSEGHVMLADFGIAKILEGETGLTTTGGVLGTPAYMSPEQGQGLPVTHQADIYSLGVIVFEMLTGRAPFSADTPMQVVLKHITEPVPNILQEVEDLPPALEPVMRRVLAKNPEERYSSAMDFAQDFLRAIHQGTTAIKLKPSMIPPAIQVTSSAQPSTNPSVVPPPQTPTGEMRPAGALTNPLVLLGGFAIIAIAMVAVVMLVVSNTGPRAAAPASVPTSAPTAIPTSVPVVDTAPTEAPQVAVPPQSSQPMRGRVNFSTARDLGDTVNVQVNTLTAPPNGMVYAIWLQNTTDQSVLGMGQLQIDASGSGILRFTDREGRTLPAMFNAVLITQESSIGDAPTGPVVYSGQLPEAVPQTLYEVFVHNQQVADSRIPAESLFDGARTVAETAMTHTSIDHSPHTVFWLHNRSEHTINVLRSSQEDYDQNEVAENPGFDVGLGTLLDSIGAGLDNVAQAAAGDTHLQESTQRLNFCLSNVRKWQNELIDKEIDWTTRTDLSDDDVPGIQAEINSAAELIGYMLNGEDFNGNGRIENFPGECGLAQIPEIGILMGSIDIHDAT